MAEEFMTIHPKEMIMSKNRMAVDTKIKLTVPNVISVNVWLGEEEKYLESQNFNFDVLPIVQL